MKKSLAALFLALGLASAHGQALSISPAGGVPGGSTRQLQYNNAGAFGGMSGTSWDDTNRSLTITGATVTASNPVLNLIQTWNNAGVTFEGYKFNIVDTASGASSVPFAIQIGGVNQLIVQKSGAVSTASSLSTGGSITSALSFISSSNSGILRIGTDTFLSRRAAASWIFGAADAASPVAQTLTVQSVVAGTSNTAGALWTIKGSAGTGTGVGGNIKWQLALAGSTGTTQNAFADALTLDASAAVPRITAGGPITSKGYTVAALPTGVAGDRAHVTDQLTACPVLGGAFTGGGAVVCTAFFDGSAWTHQ
jgi:hypothetical protein